MKKLMHVLSPFVAAVSISALLFTQTAAAQQFAQPQQTAAPLVLPSLPNPAVASLVAPAYSSSLSLQDDEYDDDSPQTPAPQTAPTPQQPATMPENVLAQIAHAHHVLLTNAGANPRFGMNADAAYSDIDTLMRQWGYYQLVNTPQEADLVFQLHEAAPVTGIAGDNATGTYPVTSPSFVVTIIDARTNITLWTVTSPAYIFGGRSHDRWLKVSEDDLISRMKRLVNQPLTEAENTELNTVPKSHGGWIVLGLVYFGALAGAGTYLLYQHSLANQKAEQDAFCKANNIPPSMCAGG